MSETLENTKTENTSVERATVVPTDPAQLAAAVRAQVEYYFSKENLKNDSFLVSKMDAQNSVAVSTVLTFAKLKALTQDEAVVIDALQGSTTVSVVDGRLKSSVKQGRNTIILREIPADTAEADIREIFNYPGCKPITSVKSDIGDTWFVVMESEADAKDTVLDLKMKKRTFNGASVKARLKSEAVVNRSYYPTTTPIANSIYPVMYPYGGAPMDMQQFGAYGGVNQVSAEGSPQGRSEDGHSNNGKNSRNDRGDGNNNNNRRVNGKVAGGRDNGNNSRGDANNRKNNNNSNSNSRSSRDTQRSSPRDTPVIEINSLNFPPLPPQGPGGEENATVSGTTVTTTSEPVVAAVPTEDYSTIGYGDKPFVKYQIDDIINIVKNIKEAVLPETIRTNEHPLAMEVSPNVDLLLRQRTFSIDETREQMQQGRPVQRDAVISGAVDYNSVMYGEDTSSDSAASNAASSKPKQQKVGGGSWAGVLKSGAATFTPAPAKTAPPAPRPAASPTKEVKVKTESKKESNGGKGKGSGTSSSNGARKEDKGRSGDKDKKENRGSGGASGGRTGNGGRRNEQKDKDREPAAPPLKWGDKPSFANVLKAKEDGVPTGAPVKAAPAQNQQRSQQRSRSGSESSGKGGQTKVQTPSAEDGKWSKQKLPPVKKTES